MEFFEEHQDSEPAPHAWSPPAAGPPRHAYLSGLGPALPPLPFTLVQSPETQFLACPRFSKGQASFSLLGHVPGPECLNGVSPPWVRLLGGGGLFVQPLFTQTSTLGSSGLPLRLALNEMWKKEGGPRGGLTSSAMLHFPVVSRLSCPCSDSVTLWGALPPRLLQIPAFLGRSPKLLGKTREFQRKPP